MSGKPILGKIKKGYVLDHLNNACVSRVIKLLGLNDIAITEYNHMIISAIGLKSKKQGSKGLIKVTNEELALEDRTKIILLNPHATISIIENGKIKEKYRYDDVIDYCVLPDFIECYKDKRCISRDEKERVPHKIEIINKGELYKCCHCDREYLPFEIKFRGHSRF